MNKSLPISTLAQMQRNFISDCLSGKLTSDNTLLTCGVDTRFISAQGLMGIYKNSAIANITQALSLTYPVIEKLVGKDFFNAACRHFIRDVWPESGNMDDYGSEFPTFLAEFEHAKHLVYLEDVARLEWALHLSSLANNAIITDWSTLAYVADILQLQFTLSPSIQLIRSSHPIDRIWQLNQHSDLQDNQVDLSLDDETRNDILLVVARPELKTVIFSVTVGEFEFLHCCEKAQTFEQAITSATLKQADFCVEESLRSFIERLVIIDFKGKD